MQGGLPEPRRMVFRVGINLGEVMVEGDDAYGGGVNIAARLQERAEPGISYPVRSTIRCTASDRLGSAARPIPSFKVTWSSGDVASLVLNLLPPPARGLRAPSSAA